MPAGRPTKYQPAYCDEIISIMAKGYSLTAAAAEIGVCRETVYAWEREIPEFSDAVKLARGKRALKLEGDLLAAESGPVVTSRIFALKNAVPHEFADKVTTEITGKDGGPVETASTVDIGRRLAFALAAASVTRDERGG